jgi:hypothetical protein
VSAKAPPFKRRIKDALDAAREVGFARVRVTTRDGTTFDFDFSVAEDNPTPNSADQPNEADAAMAKWKQQRNAAKNS